MGKLLELIDAERWRVQDLRTRFTIAKAFQDELDARTHGRLLEYANTTIHQMVIDHRYGLITRVAGWVHAVTSEGGFFDQLAANDLSKLRPTSAPADDDAPAIGIEAINKRFSARFPHVAADSVVTSADLEPLRVELRNKATVVLASAEEIRRSLEATEAMLIKPVGLEDINGVLMAAQDLLNDLAIFSKGGQFLYSEHLAHPDPTDAARDLVDLELIGTIDRLLVATGVSERLDTLGVWWWQYREEFWQALDRASQESSAQPINARAMLQVARSRNRSLTTPQIQRLVARYRLEYARYDATARSVEEKLRKTLGHERVRALITSRAKDAESLRGKLERKRAKYEFSRLEADLGSVVTDLAGVRVILYDDQDTERVAALIKSTWKGVTDEPHDGQYKARHFTVMVAEPESRSIDGARCEIQLTSLSAHAFNELEHDIIYKNHDVDPGPDVREKLKMLEHATDTLQLVIRQLLAARNEELVAGKTEITTGMVLGTILDGVFRRRVMGDFDALLYLWQGIEKEGLTRSYVERQAQPLLDRGRSLPMVKPSADDATAIAFALYVGSIDELQEIARTYPDRDSALIRAILGASASENA